MRRKNPATKSAIKNPETKSAKKSGGPKTKNPWKSRPAKNRPSELTRFCFQTVRETWLGQPRWIQARALLAGPKLPNPNNGEPPPPIFAKKMPPNRRCAWTVWIAICLNHFVLITVCSAEDCTGFKGVSFRETHLWEHFGRTDQIALVTCLKKLNVSAASLTRICHTLGVRMAYKSRLKSRDFYRKYGIRTPKIWHTNPLPPFYAIWTVSIVGGGEGWSSICWIGLPPYPKNLLRLFLRNNLKS